ncbi:MAG: NADH-quinone oxidoreductase subunit NuoB [Candidatus Omnitrophota bacterium]
MWDIIVNRFKQGYRTLAYPKNVPVFPKRFRGKPIIAKNSAQVFVDREKDPLGAIGFEPKLTVDMGKCMFNEDMKNVCPQGTLNYSQEHSLAVFKKQDLILSNEERKLKDVLDKKIKKIFKRSLMLREVCAGGCNGCEAEIQVMDIVVFDLSRFGIQFVASPRHADGLIITGPVTKNMELALKKTYEAMPYPKVVIAVGACALSGGPFSNSSETRNGVDAIIPVDLYIPGCPPHPLTILDGLLRLMGRLEQKS